MAESDIKTKYMYIRWFLLRLAMVAYDIFAVNFAYFLALLVRFYVNNEFNVWAVKYIPAFWHFAPYYTLCCLVVFGAAGLYKSLWKYASLNDVNRILISSIITCVIHVVGTLVFVMRMPITYYAFGAAFQFALIALSRFSYRLIRIEQGWFFKKRKPGTVNVLVVGTGEASRAVIKHLEREDSSIAQPVCIVDFTGNEVGGTLAGVPVMGGLQKIQSAVKEYNVERVMLADSAMSAQVRREIRRICQEIGVGVQDFSSCFQSVPSKIPVNILLEYVDGPVEILMEESETVQRQILPEELERTEKYIVSAVSAKEGTLQIRLIHDLIRPNDTQDEWVQRYEKETGEDISFF